MRLSSRFGEYVRSKQTHPRVTALRHTPQKGSADRWTKDLPSLALGTWCLSPFVTLPFIIAHGQDFARDVSLTCKLHATACAKACNSLPSWIHRSTSSTARMTTANTSSATPRIPCSKSSSRQSSVLEPSWPSACVFRQYRRESCSLTRLSDTASSMARTLCRPQEAEERGRNVTGASKLATRMDPDVVEYHREAGAGIVRLGCLCGTLEWMTSCHAYMLTTSV